MAVRQVAPTAEQHRTASTSPTFSFLGVEEAGVNAAKQGDVPHKTTKVYVEVF